MGSAWHSCALRIVSQLALIVNSEILSTKSETNHRMARIEEDFSLTVEITSPDLGVFAPLRERVRGSNFGLPS